MKDMIYSVAAIVALFSFYGGGSATGRSAFKAPAKSPDAIGCGAGAPWMINHSTPLTPGPFHLSVVYCISLPSSPFGTSPPALSPDGRRYFAFDDIRGLWTGPVVSEASPQHAEGRLAVSGFGYTQTPQFGWAADSRSIFGVRQITAKPSGFALGPLAPITIPIDGMPQSLPALKNVAGGLDGFLWVGGQGLGLAEFGTKGGYYRPEHADPKPTIAVVDGRRGKVLQAVAMPLSNGEKPASLVHAIDAQIDRRGRMYAVFVLDGHRWFEWHQGEMPHALTLDIGKAGLSRFTVSPDLKNILVMHNLSATGIMCEHNPSCPRPTPVSGVVADLRELATGRILWSVTGIATNFSRSDKPAISPDGRYALITMPDAGTSETTALVSMRDGRVLQRFNNP